jgi:hypothetical protein
MCVFHGAGVVLTGYRRICVAAAAGKSSTASGQVVRIMTADAGAGIGVGNSVMTCTNRKTGTKCGGMAVYADIGVNYAGVTAGIGADVAL